MKIQPKRVQRKRTKGFNLQAASPNGLPVVYVGRPTRFGNPYKVGEVNHGTGETVTLEKCLEYFEFYLHRKYPDDSLIEFLAPLRGKNLACFCKEGAPCHADILLRLANQTSKCQHPSPSLADFCDDCGKWI